MKGVPVFPGVILGSTQSTAQRQGSYVLSNIINPPSLRSSEPCGRLQYPYHVLGQRLVVSTDRGGVGVPERRSIERSGET